MELNSSLERLASETEGGWQHGHGYRVPCLSARSKEQACSNTAGKEKLSLRRYMVGKLQKVFSRRSPGQDLVQEVEYLLTEAFAAEAQPESPLSEVPNELLLQIMHLLSPGSLWSLRQVSSLFFGLFNDRMFRPFHATPEPRDRYIRFRVEKMTESERRTAAGLLQRDGAVAMSFAEERQTYCASCTEVLNRGESDPMKVKLRQTRFCDGCNERHACVFFPPQSIEKFDCGEATELLCVGRLGTATLCSHELAIPLTWEKIQDETTGHTFKLTCKNICHQPSPKDKRTLHGSASPRLIAKNEYSDGTIRLGIGWDRPILDIDPEYPPTLKDIQIAVANSLEGVFAHHKPCRHMLDGQRLRSFAHAGICKCFGDSSIKDRVPRRRYGSAENTCSCVRKQFLECRECAAIYYWNLRSGRITLSYRYSWKIWQPTSPAWISLLDGGPKGLGMLNEGNRHLLWCDEPACDTGMGRRWEEMLKEEIWLLHIRYGHGDYARGLDLLKEACRDSRSCRNEGGDRMGGFKLAPRLLQTKYDKDALSFLHQIERAANDVQKGR